MSDHNQRAAAVSTTRHHQRFLLRQMQFSEQFASMYRVRTKLLRDRVMEKSLHIHTRRGGKSSQAAQTVRVLGLVPGVESLVVGTLYKNMKNFTGFLSEYQKELVRIEAGDDEDGEGGEEGGGEEGGGMLDDEDTLELTKQSTLMSATGGVSLCSSKDTIVLEDESGRVELTGIDTDRFVTGMVVAVFGTLMEKGRFEVKELFFPGTPEAIPRRFPTAADDNIAPPHVPCYVAFVSGLGIGSQGEAPLALGKLVAYLVGDASAFSNSGNKAIPSNTDIAKLIVGGNIVEATEEQKLKLKVRLDPSDHVKISDTTNKNTAAHSMKCADAMLSVIADSIEIDVMPGDTDPSNAYLPQQPLHPILLKSTSKKPSARFVTNPYEASFTPMGSNGSSTGLPAARMFITSGQNVDDMLRQTNYTSTVDVLQSMLDCGCACPTAPNTLLSYPFVDKDPFTFPSGEEGPHVMVACNMKAFETEYRGGVRFVAVPSFAMTGEIVLVDVASPTLETINVVFTV